MVTEDNVTRRPRLEHDDTYDFANSVVVMKAVDLALRQYFGVEDWLTVRNRLFPGLRRRYEHQATSPALHESAA